MGSSQFHGIYHILLCGFVICSVYGFAFWFFALLWFYVEWVEIVVIVTWEMVVGLIDFEEFITE